MRSIHHTASKQSIVGGGSGVPRRGKGSHRNYSHPLVAEVVAISGKDGDDARRHLEKTVQKAIDEVNHWRKATGTKITIPCT